MKVIFNFLFKVLTKSALVVTVALLAVNYIPEQIFKDFPLDPQATGQAIDFDSVTQKWNTLLSDGSPEFIQLNQINGPESVAISQAGLIYTGLADGRLIELDPNNKYKLRTVLRLQHGQGCKDNLVTNDKCGRFLQLRFVNNTLYGLDAYSGLYMIDHKSGYKVLLGPKPLKAINLYNSFVFDPANHDIVYVTISSSKWNLLNIVWSIFDRDTSSSIIAFSIKTGKRVVVATNLAMANGMDFDLAHQRILVAETLNGRLSAIKYEVVNSLVKAALSEDQYEDGHVLGFPLTPVVPTLPGYPDNVVVEGNLAYIALPFARPNGSQLDDKLIESPKIRKAIGRTLWLAGSLIEYLSENFYKHPVLEQTWRELKCGHSIYRITKDKSGVMIYNLDTGSTRFLGSDTFGFVSEAMPDGKGNLYLGSFRSPFLVKQKLVKQ